MRPSIAIALVIASGLSVTSARADDDLLRATRATAAERADEYTTAPAAAPNDVTRDSAADDSEGDSVSCGRANRGALYGGASLPRVGFGYEIPAPWWQRGNSYGTDYLLGLIERAAATVANQHPGAVVGIADISKPGGGALVGHRSHQSGRDVDLIYYALDPDGLPLTPDEHMAYYTPRGRGTYARSPEFVRDIPERYFDLPRNWALVRALVTDSDVEVQHIFVSNRIRRWLLTYARRVGEPAEVIADAGRLLRRPHGVGSHNDHMHVRIRCNERDALMGRCRDGTAPAPRRGRRWHVRVRCPSLPALADVSPPLADGRDRQP
ncbi:MAG: hypothetical protein Tsb0020_18460 [Haliangiales bacterium]